MPPRVVNWLEDGELDKLRGYYDSMMESEEKYDTAWVPSGDGDS